MRHLVDRMSTKNCTCNLKKTSTYILTFKTLYLIGRRRVEDFILQLQCDQMAE